MKQIRIKSGDTVIIREARKSDAAEIVECINIISSQSDFLTFGQGEFGMSIEQEEKFLDSISKLYNALYI